MRSWSSARSRGVLKVATKGSETSVKQKKPASGKKVAGVAVSAKKPTAEVKTVMARVAPLLTEKQQRFVEEYLVDLNATQAAIRAGYSQKTAGAVGHENLKKPEIQSEIAAARKAQQERTELTVDSVVRRIAEIAFADPRELIELRKVACPECDNDGGIDPDCRMCRGEGMAQAVPRDTRYLSPGAAALYAGVKQTKDGLEIKMHSQLDAAEKLMRHLGGYGADNLQKQSPLADLAAAELLKMRERLVNGGA